MKVFFSFIIILLPNIFFWLLCHFFSVERPWLNLDYLLVSVLLFLPYRWPALILFVIFFLVDIMTLLSQVYVFANVEHLFYLAKFTFHAPLYYQLFIILTVGALISLVIVLPQIIKYASLTANLLLLNLCIVIYATENHFIESELNSVRLIKNIIVGSSSVHSWNTRTGHFFQFHNEENNQLFETTNETITDYWRYKQNLPDKLLLVLNESWGVPVDPVIQHAVIQPILDLADAGTIQSIEQGQSGFSGATVDAELKELCKLGARNFNLISISSGFEDCLPNILSKRGYHTQSIHSASGVLYDRIHWYPLAGFNTSKFFEHYNWQRRCFSYPGGCDFEAIKFVEDAFAQNEKLFFYWLTLNTHAIYDSRDLVSHKFECARFNINNTTQTCRNLMLQNQFFLVLSESIKSGAFAGSEIIIISDHEPVITNLEEKDQYFLRGKIPWLRFRVN